MAPKSVMRAQVDIYFSGIRTLCWYYKKTWWACMSWCVSATLGSVSVRRAGWLDRAAVYYRNLFLNDVRDSAPVQIRASLVRVPAAENEAATWDYAAVERLLALLGASEGAAPLRRALRRALRPSGPTRRFISKKESWNLFPSLGKNHANNIYYDFESESSDDEDADKAADGEFDYSDDAVLVLENPVEARLPSARISVKLLRDILESRALAARAMPSTVKSTIPWIPMNKTSSAASGNATSDADGGGASSAKESGGGADTPAAEGATTAPPALAPDADGGETTPGGEQKR